MRFTNSWMQEMFIDISFFKEVICLFLKGCKKFLTENNENDSVPFSLMNIFHIVKIMLIVC